MSSFFPLYSVKGFSGGLGDFILGIQKQFSVHILSNRLCQIAFTRLLGGFLTEARMLPSSVVIPTTAFTVPIAVSDALDSSMAGRAALYMDATKLIAARNSIRWKMPGFCLSQRMPSTALFRILSFCFPALIWGIGIKQSRRQGLLHAACLIRPCMEHKQCRESLLPPSLSVITPDAFFTCHLENTDSKQISDDITAPFKLIFCQDNEIPAFYMPCRARQRCFPGIAPPVIFADAA